MKEQVGKNECLTSEFGQLEMASQLAESEATVEMMKKEKWVRTGNRLMTIYNEVSSDSLLSIFCIY